MVLNGFTHSNSDGNIVRFDMIDPRLDPYTQG